MTPRAKLRAHTRRHGLTATLTLLSEIATRSGAAPALRAHTRARGLAASLGLFSALVSSRRRS